MSDFDWEDSDDWRALSIPEKAEMLKTAVTMTDVVELYGRDAVNDKVRPPWNSIERTPSTHLYEDHFFDYGSGRHGDIFDWVGEEFIAEGGEPPGLGARISQIRRLALRGGLEPGDVDVVPVRKLENLDFHLMTDSTEPVDVLGLPTRTYGTVVDRTTGDVLVPHWESLEGGSYLVYGIKIRGADGRKRSIPGSQFTHRLYHPTGWANVGYTTCVITEGESDCWAMREKMPFGVDVFALPSGSSSWKDEWLNDLIHYPEIRLCFDNDRAGKQALDKITRKVGFDRVKELRVPQLYNDAREAIEAGWEPSL